MTYWEVCLGLEAPAKQALWKIRPKFISADAIVTQPATAEAKTEKAAEPKAEPISAASATATPVAAQVSAPAPVK